MMKLVNRLLVIAVIAFGSWFLVQQWDKVEGGKVLDTEVTEVVTEEVNGEGDSLVIFDVDPSDKPVRKVQPIKKRMDLVNSSDATSVSMDAPQPVIMNEASEITVYLFEGGFDLSTSNISAGNITFNVRNDGRMSHEFAIEGVRDFGRVLPGEMKAFTVGLQAGDYELFSPRAVDLTLDMRETLTVENAK